MRLVILAVLLLFGSIATVSADAGNWIVSKDIRKASNTWYCFIHSSDLNVTVILGRRDDHPDVLRLLLVGDNDASPSAEKYVAVDGQRFHSENGSFDEVPSRKIIDLMTSGSTIAYEWTHWPDNAVREGEIPLTNFKDMLDDCDRWMQGWSH